MSSFPWLTVTGAIPLAGAVAICLVPGRRSAAAPRPAAAGEPATGGDGSVITAEGEAAGRAQAQRDLLVKWLALGFSLATLVLTIVMATQFNTSGPDLQFTQTYSWIPAFGVHYAVGVGRDRAGADRPDRGADAGGGARLVERRGGRRRSVKTYFALMLVLETMVIGVFAATDVFLFYVFFEAMLIPMYFMIGSYGGGAAPVRGGQVPAVQPARRAADAGRRHRPVRVLGPVRGDRAHRTFLFSTLEHVSLSPTVQKWLFLGFFVAFAIKAPLWPFHTWLPDAAAAAQPGAAVLLVGVLDKVGTFGMIRLLPRAVPRPPRSTSRRWCWRSP